MAYNQPNLVVFSLRYTGPVPGIKGWRGILNRVKKAAYYAMALLWHTGIRPGHFTRAGAQRYGYAPREGQLGKTDRFGYWRSYTGRKHKQYHHVDPLRLTGRSLRATRTARITSTSRSARLAFNAGKLALKRADLPDMEQEFTVIDQADAERMAERWTRTLERELASVLDTERIDL